MYIDAAVRKLEASGLAISPEVRSRLSPLVHEHINSAQRRTATASRPELCHQSRADQML
ncbi:hypothetical protein ACIHFC_37115 [Streptomyces sp. NPDC052013]|uniref:hypothetical protein n=1 Tax=Streptomyces sp. NPDC052013 TaxID=3365679 RepID=UPI0037D561DA